MSDVIPKDWMDESDIFSKVYRDGVRYFISFAVRYGYSKLICACPCNKCRNRNNLEIEKVRQHLLEKGIDKRYRIWAFHGEKSSNRSTVGSVQEENISEPNKEEGVPEMIRLVDVAFGVHEMPDGDISSDKAGQLESLVAEPDLGKRYEKYKVLAEEKLYPNHQGNHTTLSAVVELHNIKKMYGISGNAMSSILSTVKQWLPEGNTLPEKYPTMKTMLTDLGMTVKSIHACENHCILYYKDYENERSCPVCKANRYNERSCPVKVLKYFPIGERLKRLYTIPWIAKEMTWNHRAEVSSTHMRHPIDSPQWKLIKDKFPNFAAEGRNVWLGIATDGFNPFGFQSTSHSCWPVILVPYNLPPSLCMKSEFQMMSLLIPGPKAPGQDIDVFLQPLVDE